MKNAASIALTASAVAASFGFASCALAFNNMRGFPPQARLAYDQANARQGIPSRHSTDPDEVRAYFGFANQAQAEVIGMPVNMRDDIVRRLAGRHSLFEPQARAGDDELTPAALAEMSREDLEDSIEQHSQLIRIIGADARNEGRDLTPREERRLDAAEESLAVLQTEAANRAPRGRKTTAEPTDGDDHRTRAQRDGTRSRASMSATPRDHRDASRGGFANAGEYFVSVMKASQRGAAPDPRLIMNAPTSYGSEGIGADGGFAVPPDFRTEIVKKVMGEDTLLSLTDQMTTSGNSITVPTDETTPWQTNGGIQAYWESEAGQKTQSKPQLTEKTVKASKIIALVPMTDELLQDAPSMAAYVNSKAPDKIDFMVNDAILNGDGIGKPLGYLKSGALITVAAEGGQAADTIVFNNIVNMYTRSTATAQKRGVWLVNSDCQAQLMTMQFPGTGTAVPAYMPAGGLSAAPYGTLLGRPVIPTEAAAALGDVGDISFVDLHEYMTVVKAGGLRQDVSIHLWFDYDVTAFRFVLRVGGQPWWNTPVTRLNGLSRSPFIALAAR